MRGNQNTSIDCFARRFGKKKSSFVKSLLPLDLRHLTPSEFPTVTSDELQISGWAQSNLRAS